MSYHRATKPFIQGPRQEPGRSEAGFMSFSGLLLILVVAAILFTAFKLLPPYIDNYRLQDSLDTIARNATYAKMTEADIRREVMGEARQLGVPIDERDVQVSRNGPSVNISVQYLITVDLLVRQVDLEFAPSAGNRNIMSKP